MKWKLRNLWRLSGTIGRGPYAACGLVLFALKHNIDRLIAARFFGRAWNPLSYFDPLPNASISSLTPGEIKLLATLLLVSLPFIWIGVVLTAKRLRSIGLPAWPTLLFFVPLVNLVFFVLLSIVPAKQGSANTSPGEPSRLRMLLNRTIPRHAFGNAALASLIAAALTLGAVYLTASVMGEYGWGLFVAIPFCQGFVAAVLHGYHERQSFGNCLVVAIFSVLLVGAGLLAFAIEGLICILMAASLALVLSLMGASVGYLVQHGPDSRKIVPQAFLSILVLAPLIPFMDSLQRQIPAEFEVRSSVVINASPEVVWKNVVSFSLLPPPREWLFHTGIAYPTKAEILGSGAGAERRCLFTTGAFVEPIEVWDEPRLLRFSVRSQPPAMAEWSPYEHLHPPHLDRYFETTQGQFLLTPLPGDRTLLEGTTWYHHRIWPSTYWKLWSDYIIHKIHLRVLRHVQSLAEAGTASSRD